MSMRTGHMLSKRQHILHRPQMYVGNIRNVETEMMVYQNNEIVPKRIEYNEALDRIVLEILSNAMDNKWVSDQVGKKMTYISVDVQEDGRTTIANDGNFIPIVLTKYELEDERNPENTITQEMYPPQCFFGEFLSGTNYDMDGSGEKRRTSGLNGLGSKLTNVFSKEFKVTCLDPERKKKYEQTFKNNASVKPAPKITSYNLKKGMTQIEFLPDFSQFGVENYSEDFLALFKKHCVDCSMFIGIAITFNGEKINVRNLQQYSKLYLQPDVKSVHFKSDESEVVITEQSERTAMKKGFRQVSFVNGIITIEGGVHVDAWVNAILVPIRNMVNELFKPKKNEKTKQIKINLEQLKKYFFVFVKCEVDKPEFGSQSKHKLLHPKPQVAKPSDVELKKILKWDFVEYLKNEIKSQEDRKIAKTDGKQRFIGLGKNADDANWAGGKNRKKCTLLLTEGLSAKGFVTPGIDDLPNGYDMYGSLALRGKPVNVTNNSVLKVNENAEIQLIKKMLGLEHGADYSKDSEFDKLRYGQVVLLCDADDDGIHISGLLLNYFWREFPELFARNYVKSLSTPSVRILNKGLTFYTHAQFKKWEQQNRDKEGKPKIRYYKGLGSNTPKDSQEIFKDQKLITYYEPENDIEYYMDLGFNDKFSDNRKEWLTNYDPQSEIYEMEDGKLVKKEIDVVEGNQSLTDFVDTKLILYHKRNLDRTLPNAIDGLKESQRKILYTCMEGKTKESVKVVQLAGAVMEKTLYHHGDASLHGAITKMAQGFVGSNNIPLLFNDGQFGSREQGGEDAASPRYIFTRLENIVRKIYREEDDALLTYVEDEGKTIEPVNYVPIIPMILVNGAKGIASGFATDILSYNPETLVEWIEKWIHEKEKNEQLEKPKLIPWWRNYKGEVTLKETGKVQTVTTRGLMHKEGNTYHVTELPVKVWTNKFKEYIETEFLKEKHITKLEKKRGNNEVHFVITPSRDFIPDIDANMKMMTKSVKLSTMVALFDDKPKKYETPEEIIEDFCGVRYELYQKRKEHLLKRYRTELRKDKNKYKFITEIINKTLVIFNREEQELFEEMRNKKYDEEPGNEPFGYLINMSIRSMTKQRLEVLKKSINSLKQKILNLQQKSPGRLWSDDLEEFKTEYSKFLKTRDDGKVCKKKK